MKPLPCLMAFALGLAPTAAVAAGPNAPAPMAPAGARYVITVVGRDIGPFQQLVSLDAGAKPPTLVLKHGVGTDISLQAWRQQALAGDPLAHKQASLRAVGPGGKVLGSWALKACWPTKVANTGKKASPDETMGTVQLTCAAIQKTG